MLDESEKFHFHTLTCREEANVCFSSNHRTPSTRFELCESNEVENFYDFLRLRISAEFTLRLITVIVGARGTWLCR